MAAREWDGKATIWYQAGDDCSAVRAYVSSPTRLITGAVAAWIIITVASWTGSTVYGSDSDRLKSLQTVYAAAADQKVARAYHFGSQGAGDVFSNHTSHTNRLVPVYIFGTKADLASVTGQNSRYRDPEQHQGPLRIPAGKHAQSPCRLRRPERPL